MKENQPNLFEELSTDQLRAVVDAQQLFEAWGVAFTRAESFRGGMHWKTSGGKQYLFRTRDRRGYGKSLGPLTPETERTLEQFKRAKTEAKEREAELRRRLAEQARYCKAARVARVPRVTAALARGLWRAGLNDAVLVVGTNALYAYEAACGVRILSAGPLETRDLDLLLDSRRSLQLITSEVRREGLIGILRKIDKSFSLIEKEAYRAVNDRGYMVDLIRPMPKPPWKRELDMVGSESDLKAADIQNLEWLLSAPKLRQIIIGEDGFPARITVPDPRVFALHKLWLSRQPERDPLKKPKDRHQAFMVAELVARYLPQIRFSIDELRMLPREVAELSDELLDHLDSGGKDKLPPGFEPSGDR
ncbi:MAG: nucleotidyltransferase domain-containing protein [Candidatus Binataceae bacterium]